MQEQIPYKGAKLMHLVDDVDNKELLKEIVIETCRGLHKWWFKEKYLGE